MKEKPEEKSTEPGVVLKKSQQWYWLPTTIFFVGIVSIILLLRVNNLSERQHTDSLMVDAMMDIEIKVASAHLRLEEAIGGDATADAREIMEYIDEAIKLNDAALNGGETEHGRITEPLNYSGLRTHGEAIRQDLVKLKTIAWERLQGPEKSGIGSISDQQFDAVFTGILADAGAIDDLIGKNKARDWEKSRHLFIWRLIILIFIITAATAGLMSYEKLQRSSKEALRKSHELLNESEASLRTLVQTIPDLIWLKDAKGVYLSCNTMFERFFGAREAEIIGKTDYDFVDRDMADFFREHDRKAMAAGRPSSNEEWITFADDGHRALLETIKTPMYEPGGKLIGVLGIARDITGRKQAEEAIEKLSRKNESILNAAGEGIMGLDTEGRHTFVNPAAARMLGYSEDELIGERSHEVWHHTKPDGSPRPVEECPIYATFRDGAVHHETEDVFWRKGRSSFSVEYKSTPIIEQGNVVGAVVAFSDINEMIKLREQLEKLSITDALTGFYNLRGFLALAKPKLKLSLRKMETILLIYADMDNLKAINDSSGHQEGDKALAEIANILKSTFRESDILARLGGDEFAILAIDTSDEKAVQERIQKKIDSYNKKVGPVHKLSLSVGVVCYDPEKPSTLDELLIKADALMYENKLSKKNKGLADVTVQMRDSQGK